MDGDCVRRGVVRERGDGKEPRRRCYEAAVCGEAQDGLCVCGRRLAGTLALPMWVASRIFVRESHRMRHTPYKREMRTTENKQKAVPDSQARIPYVWDLPIF